MIQAIESKIKTSIKGKLESDQAQSIRQIPGVYLFALVIFSLPAVLVQLNNVSRLGRMLGGIIFLIFGSALFVVAAYKSYPSPGEPTYTIPDDVENEALLTAFTELGEEFRYRDQLLLRSTYFSFAIVALLLNLLVRIEPRFRPGLALIGSLLAFAFLISVASEKGTRDQIRDARSEMTDLGPLRNLATSADVGTIRNRPLYAYFSAGTYIEMLHVFIFVGWVLVYFIVSINVASDFSLYGPFPVQF